MKSIQSYRLLLSVFISLMVSMPVKALVAERTHPGDALQFSFYGEMLQAASLKTVGVESVSDYDISKAWHEYQKRDVAPVLSSLHSLSDELGLNDWFVFELVRSYANELLRSSGPMDRVLLEHYLLVSMGYDVRLARTERQLLLLVPFEQEVYERFFIKINGQDYYLFFDDLEFNPNEKSVIYPCDPIRSAKNKGQTFDLMFKEKVLNVSPEDDRICDFDDGQIHIACTVNPQVMRMLRDYPLMDLQCYAASVVLPQFHVAIQEQLMPQLEGMSQCDAADALLHFVQYVFGYEDDVEQYGQEKVNFVEENFFYDNNDCEDRSILYAFLVNSLLGLDVQFIHYPGHECTGVRFTDCLTRGNGYYYGEDYYLICDPSYIGGTIGRCMPEYRAVQPVVKSMIPISAFDSDASPLAPRLDKRLILSDITIDSVSL
ncbi:MAG: hypothetical protein IKZ92_00970 [Muribaculaceae bacterium]|nr:hypothetical protein [Muribaculaceae bacterium]